MPKLLLTLLALTLAGCAATTPPKPPVPNDKQRVPVNQTLPFELNQVPQ